MQKKCDTILHKGIKAMKIILEYLQCAKTGEAMNNEYELNFIREIFKKWHIRTAMLSLHDTTDCMLDSWISAIIGARPESNMTVHKTVGTVESNTEYKFVNELKLRYVFMRLPLLSERNILFIGPYLSAPLSPNEILEIGERLGLNPGTHKLLKEYYSTLPIISENDRLFTLIDTFCEHIWQTPSFSITEIVGDHTLSLPSAELGSHEADFNEALANMERMEARYAFENELISAITLGQQHKEKLLTASFHQEMFEKRLQDPLRNAKNYCIIMNTLFRKAAENGGVHPIYIDRTSSKIATQIERISDVKAIPTLMRETFSAYCRLVRKHSTKQYSPIVKKTVLMIDSDISAELSLGILAKKQGISAGYLATIFKKEVGKTISEYIREKRIRHAIHLLNTTNLQIQTVAMHCGIMDVQYFSKIFKKQIGKTPKEYRETLRR